MCRWSVVWLIGLTFCAGCGVAHFRAETELQSDGRVTRVICQPSLPDQRAAGWDVRYVQYREDIASDEFSLDEIPFRVLKPANPDHPDERQRYVLARGEFPSANKLVPHYRRALRDNGPAAVLNARVERKDLVFVTVHVWEETLTDTVRLDEIPVARRELVEFAVPLMMKLLRRESGVDVDLSSVEAWLKDEGAKWFDELVWWYVDSAVRLRSDWDAEGPAKEQVELRLKQINLRHGLKGNDPDDMRSFLVDALRRLVKSKDGKPLADDQIVKVLRLVGIEERPEEVPDPVEQLIVEEFGSEEAFNKRLEPMIARIIGVHHPWQDRHQFDYRLKMPGFIGETNGKTLPNRQVHWRFQASEAYPFGYAMRCRSFEPNLEAQQAAFGKHVLTTFEACDQFVRLMSESPEWLEPLRECASQKSRKPLIDLRRGIMEAKDKTGQKRFGRLFKLLLPAEKSNADSP